MSTTATYTVTMAELKGEQQHGSLWSNYGSPVQMSGRFGHIDGSVSGQSAAQQLSRQRSGNPSMDYPPYHYGRHHSQDDGDAYERHQQSSIQAHQSYPNLKRPYPHAEQPPYAEIVQDLRDDGSKLSVNHDHKLLSFKKAQEKSTIVDQHGRIQQLELSAQLHGMFFLSEMPSTTSDGTILQPELTCYRRNLFQISGSLITPRSPLSVVTETGETVPVSTTEVTISAIESVDGHPVRLIVIPWKTPPPNSPEISTAPDQEPPTLPLIPFQDEGAEVDGEYAVYPIGWRRLQFRIATANNGRRKELQQHFVLHLKVVATLTNGSKAVLTEATTSPIVVRGRSPRNFQARKEIPLLGSSAGSRGQALVETGLGIVAGPLAVKPQDAKARGLTLDLPRTAFTFNAGPKMPQSPMGLRSNSYPTTWNPSSMSHIATTGTGYPATTVSADPYHKMPLSGGSSFSTEPQDLPLQTSMPAVQLSLVSHDQQPIRTQYANYSSAPPQLSIATTAADNLSMPRYVESSANPRPTKSPRHASHPSIHSTGSLTNDSPSGEYRYGPPYVGAGGVNTNHSNEMSPVSQQAPTYASGPPTQESTTSTSSAAPTRDYFPPSQSWTTSAGDSATTYANGDHTTTRTYPFPDQYKTGHSIKQDYPPHSTPGVYPGQPAPQYQWGAT